ncbi:cyclophilin-like fold protein [Microbacterium sp. PRC9]|uniref:cyclophilin-like fold protein n=1 Tax=Microbacterium sp. PRC9 TaxID=2962591 RepID=UPI0028817708|nr:cyclophilin-like fold protein [Microbacterium sp. PRC9]MDT0141773.1 cyclophilin-like fold protein [Microbacterium sp. PRC9]
MKKPLTTLIVGSVLALTLAGCAAETAASPSTAPSTATSPSATVEPTPTADAAPATGDTAITLTSGDTVITATLNDTQVSRDFIAMLPITLPWFRNSGIEYITELSAPLTEDGPFYTDVQPGDLVYYNPRDSITIIYEETSSVPTLTYMGEITSDLTVFRDLPDDVEWTIALAE